MVKSSKNKNYMKVTSLILLFFLSFYAFAQQEKAPVFNSCKNKTFSETESCFFNVLEDKLIKDFQIPNSIKKEGFKGAVRVLFTVDVNGDFIVNYTNAPFVALKEEIIKRFKALPKVAPATYNGRAIEKQFYYDLHFPLEKDSVKQPVKSKIKKTKSKIDKKEVWKTVTSKTEVFPEDKSPLLIPFTHDKYDFLQADLLQHNNQHFSVKPFLYNEVNEVIDLDAKKQSLLKPATTWLQKKWWNEHFFAIKGKKDGIHYWFTVDPEIDLQIGKDNSDLKYTYNNTRAVKIQGGIGSKFGFSASIYESQGRFANYINTFNNQNKIVIGRGKFKRFKTDAFDYPVAEAYLSYSPNKIFNFQFGQGKNFIGNGYRSLFLSDVASPYPYLKISTTFWKIRYTNMWLFLDDIRSNLASNGEQIRKFVGIHHLSYNVNSKLNLSLFESVISNNENGNQFDISYFNPIILYRAAEFNKGSKLGNALVGLGANYKLKTNFILYTQFLLDEMTIAQLKKNNGYWANKFGIQAGYKYFNAFGIKNLLLQGEVNIVRPFTYSHKHSTLNYAHFNQSIAHPWGANFYEFIGIVRYQKDRWFANAKLNYGKKGFDFEGSTASYGGDIFKSYDDRVSSFNNKIAQGNTTSILIGDLQVGYLVNPSTNLRLFSSFTYRNLSPKLETTNFKKQNNIWFTFGLKTDVFNWYSDF